MSTPKKSSAQLDREIAEVLTRGAGSRSHHSTQKKRQLKIYDVGARIVSGISDEDMWEGSFEIPASSLQAARKIAVDLLHESTYYDPRIDPKAVLDHVEHIGEVEVTAAETPAQAAAVLIAEARAGIP
jgi:hypothetical protein